MTPSTGTNLELILAAIAEVKTMVTGLDGRVRALEGAIITQSITATQRLDAAFNRIDEHTRQITDINTDLSCKVRERIEVTDRLSDKIALFDSRIKELEGMGRGIKWIAGLFGAMIAVLLWKIFTGEIVIK